MKMNTRIWHFGVSGKKWGIYNTAKKEWQFGICEDTPMLAQARLYHKIGNDARKYRFETKELPKAPASASTLHRGRG